MNWCKILGHLYEPVFIKGTFGDKEVKFIGAKCKRCGFGQDELVDTVNKMDLNYFCTYSEKYWQSSHYLKK